MKHNNFVVSDLLNAFDMLVAYHSKLTGWNFKKELGTNTL